MNAPWRAICLEIPLLKKMFLLPSTISVWKCHPLERWSILLCGLGSDRNWYWREQWINKSVCLFTEEQCYLPCPAERDTVRVLLLHAASEAVKAAGWEGAGRSYLQAAFFTIKIPCSSRFVWILNNTSTGWEHWQIQQADPGHLLLQVMLQSRAGWKAWHICEAPHTAGFHKPLVCFINHT